MIRSKFNQILHVCGIELDTEHDAWGNSMDLFFNVAEVLDASDIEGDVTPEPFARWEYWRGMGTVPAIETITKRAEEFREGEFADDYSYETMMLASAYQSEEITQDDLIYLGDVLDRYTNLLRNSGKDGL